MRGKFIVIEGLDGSGKGTQIELLCKRLDAITQYVLTHEPTDGVIGKMIRSGLAGEHDFSLKTMALLFAADRHEHCKEIEKYLKRGINVISDRYVDSNYAYQGEELGNPFITVANEGIIQPDFTVFLDVDVSTACERLNNREGITEIYENKSKLISARRAYMNLYSSLDSSKYVIIPQGDAMDVHKKVYDAVRNVIVGIEED